MSEAITAISKLYIVHVNLQIGDELSLSMSLPVARGTLHEERHCARSIAKRNDVFSL